jgi:nucleoside-diphosphate-sugar epimerase
LYGTVNSRSEDFGCRKAIWVRKRLLVERRKLNPSFPVQAFHPILRPNNFFQNDYWFKNALLQYNVYPQPIGDKGLSRVDVTDIAEAATITLTTDGHEGKTYNLVGPDVLTGAKTAEMWGEAIGQPINYAGNDLDAWEQQFLQYLPAPVVFDFKLMYQVFQEEGFTATDEDIKIQTKLLGHPPRSFKDFTQEVATQWKN